MLVLVLGAAAVMPAGAAAIPVTGPHETVDITTSTTQPDSPAGLTYAATYRNPTNPNADPPALRRLVISLPAGTHIDTSVPARCDASDEELRVLGDAACPPGSRVGSGQATVDIVGLGRMTFNTTLFNAADQQIELVESGNALGSYGVVHTYVHGTTLDGPVPTCLTGGEPPDGCPFDQITLLSNHLTVLPVTVGAGASQRSYGSTPPTCPPSGRWQGPVTFYYADGTVETVVMQARCTRPAGSQIGPTTRTPPHPPRAQSRRRHRHRRSVHWRHRSCRGRHRGPPCSRGTRR